jgi:predicted DNA-binding transcriptional regulator YafY/dihydrofolate reductase
MDPSGGRSGRLLSTLLLLQSRGSVTAREIAAYLGVSMRTVYRDIDVLYAIGVPLYAETGRDGGYHLVDGYRTTLTGLTAQESLALFLIGLPAPAASLGLSEQARSAEAKLLAALGQGPREQASRLRDRFLLDLPPWYADSPPPPGLPRLADAVLAGQQVRVRYRRWQEPREVRRLLDPLGLVVKNGLWYLVAADRTGKRAAAGSFRVYRVSNILELEVLDAVFERPEPFDLADFWRDRLAEFDAARLSGQHAARVTFFRPLAAFPSCTDARRGANWAPGGRPVSRCRSACIAGLVASPAKRRTEMGKIVLSGPQNVSLDGVVQDPTGDEGFGLGGWFVEFGGKDLDEWAKVALDEALGAEAWLLGRRSYEYFGTRWGSRSGELADRLNSMPKYVVSATLADPSWNNSRVLRGDAVTEVSKLKQELDGEIVVPASNQLARTLLEHDLVDEVRLVVFPVILGAGERLFGEISGKKPLRLLDSKTIGDGLAFLSYEFTRGA